MEDVPISLFFIVQAESFFSQKKKKRKKVNPATACTAFSCFRLETLIKVTEDQDAPITPKEIIFETVQSDLSLGQRN